MSSRTDEAMRRKILVVSLCTTCLRRKLNRSTVRTLLLHPDCAWVLSLFYSSLQTPYSENFQRHIHTYNGTYMLPSRDFIRLTNSTRLFNEYGCPKLGHSRYLSHLLMAIRISGSGLILNCSRIRRN